MQTESIGTFPRNLQVGRVVPTLLYEVNMSIDRELQQFVKNTRVVKRRNRLVNTFLILILIFSIVSCFSLYLKQEREFTRLYERQQTIEALEKQAEVELDAAKELANRAGTDSFIERIARDELALTKPGEIIFKNKD